MGDNKIERLSALPTHLAYMGWCNLSFQSRLSAAELREHSKDFQIKITAAESFEAAVAKDAAKKAKHDDKSRRTLYPLLSLPIESILF